MKTDLSSSYVMSYLTPAFSLWRRIYLLHNFCFSAKLPITAVFCDKNTSKTFPGFDSRWLHTTDNLPPADSTTGEQDSSTTVL